MIPIEELIPMLEERLGVKGDAALARALGLGVGGDKKIKRWREGTTPRYEDAWILLDHAKLLRKNGEAGESLLGMDGAGVDPALSSTDVTRLDHARLAAVEARAAGNSQKIEQIYDLNVESFEKLETLLTRVVRRLERLNARIARLEQSSGGEASSG